MYFYCKSLFILIVVYLFLLFVRVFLTLSMYSYFCLCIIVRPCILNVVCVFLLLSVYYCSSMYSYRCLCILIVVYVFLDAATLTFSFYFPFSFIQLGSCSSQPLVSFCPFIVCFLLFYKTYL